MQNPALGWAGAAALVIGGLWLAATFLEQTGTPANSHPGARHYTYQVVNVYPHDRTAFTQGLAYADGFLYEGTGLTGQSSLRKVELKTGRVVQFYSLPQEIFGEGITLYDGRIVQLTWQSKVGYVYDLKTFRLLQTFPYRREGWGATYGSNRLIFSEGSDWLYYYDPETLRQVGQLQVRDGGKPVRFLNELEWVKGEIFANVWQSDRVVRISPKTGNALGWIDLQGLLSVEDRVVPVDVLNGIAYDPTGDRFFVTGKLWPKVFEIKIVPAQSSR
ncbi:MAG: glutaminyl-peptide cyclotransferase [Acidobacteriota bacterium]